MTRSRLAPPANIATSLRWTAPMILAFTVGALVLALTGYAREVDRIRDETRLLAAGAAVDVDRYVQSQFTTLEALAAADDIASGSPARMADLLDRVDVAQLGFDGGVAWINSAGMMVARNDYEGPPLDYSDRDYVQVVLETGRPWVSDVRIGELNRAPIVALAIPTRDARGMVTGVLVGGFRLDQDRSGSDNLRFAGATAVEIVDRSKHIVVGPTTMDRLVNADPAFEAQPLRDADQGVITDAVSPYGAGDRLIGWSRAMSADWLVLVDRSMTEAFGNARSVLAIQLLVVGLAGAIAVAATLFALHRIAAAERRRAAAFTAESEATEQLQVAVTQLREREQLRDAFVGVLSHELRTPVTSIYGAAKLLARAPDRADRDSLVQDIEDESDRLYRMIEDLLVLSRAERGRLQVTAEPVLVQRLMPAVEGDLRRRFPSTRFGFDLPDTLPPVSAEPGPVRQILNNLLTNAAKYGGGSEVRMTASATDMSVRLVVEDSGPGFSQEEADRLFELFYRSPDSARLAAGTGIGLYVVRSLVEAMGGTVVAEPRHGGGARFTVALQVFDEDAP